MGDYQDAYQYSVITRNLGDSINDLSKKEQMIMNSINREQQVRDKVNEEQKRESERMIRQKKTERNMMAGETAEERQKFEAKAKYFSEVTVMFTDFKDFTQASEKLNPDELVEEIHFYFSEFDRIVTRYGIEKIISFVSTGEK